jgi:hypothetical protein
MKQFYSFVFVLFFILEFVFAQSSTIIISEVLYDTPLPESTNAHDGEFVSLYNYGNSTIDISGWQVRATSINTTTTPTYTCTFPENTQISPRSIAVVAFRTSGSNFCIDSFYNSFSTNDADMIFYQNSLILPNTRTALKIYSSDNVLQDEIGL